MPISKLLTLTFALVPTLLAASASRAAETARSPEQVTMDRMRAIAGALLSRQIDETSGENRLGGPAAGWTAWVRAGQASTLVRMPPEKELRSHSEVVALLRPREDFIYLCDVPERDAWGERIEVYYEEEKMLTGRHRDLRQAVRALAAGRRGDGAPGGAESRAVPGL